ncbi:Endopolyphosphatase [Lojkania enalia]|uniref:Endopolyphosphatase n=1 Tax=Lojkania enalia TaxID=147567 RepID=A0A9P4N311_9PLEO|nr:Endopolyphosphatase [Didymosphaeria enalia]
MLSAPGALVWALLLLEQGCRAAPQSAAGTRSRLPGTASPPTSSGRRLHGRFLHITDVHPDPFYKTYSSTAEEAACHRKRGPAGIYGAETSACDSPISLVNETFKWIRDNLKDSIDFVVWTGDSARHDNDEKIPRTENQIIQQNELLVTKFTEVFGKDDNINDTDPTNDFTIPIVPTFGNNDIMPHNIFQSGPNKWSIKYLDIWRNFIPEAQRHQFQQGGWFYVEVIPAKLAVISLNTLYFFDSNSAVDGCANKHEPGYEHMDWLRIQLQRMRERGIKAILMGHVPPARTNSKLSWDETCWQKYTLWQRQYRDVIVGSLYGHMNIDHFMLQDFQDLKKGTKKGEMKVKTTEQGKSLHEDGEVTVASASDYILSLRDEFAKLPAPPKTNQKALPILPDTDEEFSIWRWFFSKLPSTKKGGVSRRSKRKYLDEIGGKYAQRYSVTHVSPSVVPNFFPTLRVFEYNIDGLEGYIVPFNASLSASLDARLLLSVPDEESDTDYEDNVDKIIDIQKKKKEKESRKKNKKYKFKIPAGPSKSAPPGPAYSLQTFSFLRYTQWFANLTQINNDFVAPTSPGLKISPRYDIPQTIFGLKVSKDGNIETRKWKEGKHGEHQGKKPRPKPHPNTFKFEIEYDTATDKAFRLKDLTVRSYVDLARRIGEEGSGDAKLDSEYEEQNEDIENESDDSMDDDKEVDSSGKKEKKKGNKGKKKRKNNGTWFTFVKRAFVGTMDPKDIEEIFCKRGIGEEQQQQQQQQQQQEVIEL